MRTTGPTGSPKGRQFRQGVLALYAVHAANYILPFLLIPFLARTLGPTAWGQVGLVQSVCLTLALLVEYGFELSATRAISQAHDLQERANIAGSVIAARLFLAVFATAVLALLGLAGPLARDPLLLAIGSVWALSLSFSPTWYFLGRQRMQALAAIDLSTRLIGAGLVFLWVDGPEDAWKALGLQAAACLLGSALANAIMLRELGSVPLHDGSRRLKDGRPLFFFKASVSTYTTANGFILGMMATPMAVALFLGGEKIARAAQGLLGPLMQAMFPRLSALAAVDLAGAARLARLNLAGMAALGLALSMSIYVAAPWAVPLVLGPGYSEAVTVVRILAPLPTVVAVSNVLGIQWMVPRSMDRPFLGIILLGGAVSIGSALALAPIWSHLGMAIAVLAGEMAVSIGMLLYLSATSRAPWSSPARPLA